jgi:hypothetical protein
MRVDFYTKTIMTIIAVALVGVLWNSIARPIPVSAQPPLDYSRLQVSASGNQLVAYSVNGGTVDVFNPNGKAHIAHYRIAELDGPLQ